MAWASRSDRPSSATSRFRRTDGASGSASGWQAALARLDAIPFDTLVPGHGALMTHAQFTTWRGAFDHLLACAASDADAASCKAGWLRDAGPLLHEPADHALAGTLLEYYLPQVLRAPAARRARYCAAGRLP